MLAACIVAKDDSTTVEIRVVDTPPVAPEQVRIEVRAASVNRADLAMRQGQHLPPPAPGTPRLVGLDSAGQVTEVGADVKRLAVGDRVMTMATGGLAEEIVVDARQPLRIPEAWTWEEGAAAVVGLMTEHQALADAASLAPGETVLVHGATSGVGLQGVQMARVLRAGSIIATSRRSGVEDLLASVGADVTVSIRDESWPKQVREAAGGSGVDVVADHVGASLLSGTVAACNVQARVVNIGRMGGARAGIDLEELARRRISMVGVSFRTRTADEKAAIAASVEQLDLPAHANDLRPVLHAVWAWDRINEAQAALESGEVLGKLVMRVN